MRPDAEPMAATDDISELDDAGFDAWLGLWKAQVLIARKLERELRQVGAPSLASCEVLSRLSAAPGRRMQMQELARRCFVSKSGISQIVTQLAKDGLVERQGDATNLRVTYAVLTSDGADALERSAPRFFGAIREQFSTHLTPEEIAQVRSITDKLITAHGERAEAATE
ncbi:MULTISPECIES: MarR family transcriptional regulator [unclassified Pseudonocardia]|uniref:MarR family winged helix-turn-helix transcriptional regulator n=1 Tax=unclassified Pseudonocardia TaxID=2619320 RepID=UPI00095B7BC3|nr:MarR family transcriptional regulator [Pseudonocardia sp. Ae707_Ps1]OLM21388.1 Transcriptional regulator, MarR family [Pseudonocardia sp. Ae707_Ps1]